MKNLTKNTAAKINLDIIHSELNQNKSLFLPGLGNLNARGFIINQLIGNPLQKSISAVLYLAKNNNELKKIELILKYYHNLWPTKFKIITYTEPNFAWFNLYLNNQPTIFLASIENLSAFWPSLSKIEKEKINLKIGCEISLTDIKQYLHANALRQNKTVQQAGDYAVQGNIISFWLAGLSYPIKLELTDNKIQQIFSFDRQGQRREDIAEINLTNLAGRHFKSTRWWDYFDLIFTDDDSQDHVLKNKKSKLVIFNILKTNKSLDLEIDSLPAKLPGKLLEQKIKNLNPEYIFTNLAVNPDFTNAKIIKIPDFIYLDSWFSRKLKIVWLVQTYTPDKKPADFRKQQLFFNKIKEGDLLVHQDHGLCQFAKITKQTIADQTSEYLELRFAGADKLFLPPYQISKVTKYVGEPNPKLNKLSGVNWLATMKKIREETFQLAFEIIRTQAIRNLNKITPFKKSIEEKQLAAGFLYKLTPDQTQAWQEIESDLENDTPMDRLLCGDVAFGKTELALRAAYKAVVNNTQVALLAPTTILVQQHYDLFCERLKPWGVRVGILSRWQNDKKIKNTLKDLAQGKIDVIIGTHRLLSHDVKIPNLKMLIIDEEQKFGVKAKEKLKQQKPHLHTLTLSATPIPRTLNYSLSGLKDISLIQTPPPGRRPIVTSIMPFANKTIKNALEQELGRGGQAYYLVRKVKDIPIVYKNLKKIIPQASIGIAHGQLAPRKLALTMQEFDQGKINVLLCSTIIENGLDLPNVNTLIVDNAAYFGLAQLYQLRGRIGRSRRQGYAYFLFQRQKLTGQAQQRLEALQSSYELGAGFDIALKDLEIRGTGNLLGKEQHGEISAIGLNLYTELLEQSINSLKNSEPLKPKLDVIIDLPIPISLSEQDEPNNAKRLAIYQQLSFLNNEDELLSQARKLFGKNLSDNALNMINILQLKLICEKIGIFEVLGNILTHDPFNAKITMQLIPNHNRKNILRLLKENSDWEYDGTKLKIKTSQLKNKNWLKQLIKEVEILSASS